MLSLSYMEICSQWCNTFAITLATRYQGCISPCPFLCIAPHCNVWWSGVCTCSQAPSLDPRSLQRCRYAATKYPRSQLSGSLYTSFAGVPIVGLSACTHQQQEEDSLNQHEWHPQNKPRHAGSAWHISFAWYYHGWLFKWHLQVVCANSLQQAQMLMLYALHLRVQDLGTCWAGRWRAAAPVQ